MTQSTALNCLSMRGVTLLLVIDKDIDWKRICKISIERIIDEHFNFEMQMETGRWCLRISKINLPATLTNTLIARRRSYCSVDTPAFLPKLNKSSMRKCSIKSPILWKILVNSVIHKTQHTDKTNAASHPNTIIAILLSCAVLRWCPALGGAHMQTWRIQTQRGFTPSCYSLLCCTPLVPQLGGAHMQTCAVRESLAPSSRRQAPAACPSA